MSRKAKELMEEVLATFAVLIENHMEDINPFEIEWETSSEEFFNGNQELFGLVMIKFHLIFGLEINYDMYTEFSEYPTLQHAWNDIVDRVLEKEGFDPVTLKPKKKKWNIFS